MNDMDLRTTDEGSGPVVVLLHGLGGNRLNFTHSLAPRLSQHYRVIVVDRAGYGESPSARGDFTLNTQVAGITETLDQLGVRDALVVGHSLGGAVATALAINRRDLVRRLAMVTPFLIPVPAPPPVFRRLMIQSPWRRRWVTALAAAPLAWARRRQAAAAIFAPDAPPLDFDARGGAAIARRPRDLFTISTEVTGANTAVTGLIDRAKGLTAPVSVLGANQDRMLDPRLHIEALTAALPQTAAVWIDGGHMLPIAHADQVAAWIRREDLRI